ncbi:hypothetical protein N1027_17680 [Herbiconiux sp. CPCC 205763]|uniref:Polyketide cyclase / dehydrase and lipid transport n=1 Tax=Herbiconiux aconitum TaxID=2970913 RepID=A0ABT2GUT3_9MICO|nr:hypothetical protein [Herbiconiux aconitum]MCS5719965.1 hypothetical protein [Herbiconiux aconitum]
MASLTLVRPQKHTVVRSFAGHLEAAPDAVFRGLVQRFGTLRGGDEGQSLVDEASRTVIVQGNWWYRGEYRARPEGTGTLLEYEIVNVAPTVHWAGPIAGRREIRSAPAAFQALLTELEAEATA